MSDTHLNHIIMERKGYAFFVELEYERVMHSL